MKTVREIIAEQHEKGEISDEGYAYMMDFLDDVDVQKKVEEEKELLRSGKKPATCGLEKYEMDWGCAWCIEAMGEEREDEVLSTSS